jgi:hypothetical protein
MKNFAVFLLLLVSYGMPVSTTPGGGTPPAPSTLLKAINNLCYDLTQLLPVVSMLMVVVAGVIYAAGQVMGAETRARANVWATAALTGALIGLLIYAIAPPVLQTIYGTGTYRVDCSGLMS